MEEPDYELALACARKLIGMIDADPGMPKHVLLSHFVFAILVTMRPSDTWED
jgi:hypothetical protein